MKLWNSGTRSDWRNNVILLLHDDDLKDYKIKELLLAIVDILKNCETIQSISLGSVHHK